MRLVRAVHDALNATAVPRTPDPALLPPRVDGSRRLPAPGRVDGTLAEALEARRSSYSLGAGQPALADLATLLHLGVGTAPRAGGLPSVVPYVVARGPGELAPGVHRADLRHPVPNLAVLRAGDPTPYVAAALDQPPFATRAPIWLALVVDVERTLRRYPPRHYRTLHLDAGAALQNLLLVATALGLPACPVMGYDDRAWSELLVLPEGELLAVLVALGRR
ncbi:nitroreductase family protein [Nocardioides lianchengensis]|uniref:SagB-type dehydrogenase domain-containing protein n=1 Tax=Nocardioides lianchengensis TaxID=1045774 RepID=A0A1G6W124_9ACTN|nr:nitroreductase family protein [Nocardioides lianchengensis]NYG09483.1 SagB-type dehydrogenase family enzyme [Nocardioides lianchengensis]SDD59413.1 SagB-type dehydrogenase domain-containing protein [Nocardioides lianchengensis]